MNLRTPGPIPVPEDILESMSWQMINHRGPEYKDLLYRTTEGVKQVFETENDLYIITSSGTGAMEAAIVNTLSPGDKVVNVCVGVFGERFGDIAELFGAEVISLDFPYGSAADPDTIRDTLSDNPDVKAVLVTHNETSTGVTNDLQAIAAVVKGEFDKLLLVDGISSVCSIPISADAWGLRCSGYRVSEGLDAAPGTGVHQFQRARVAGACRGKNAALLLRHGYVQALLRDRSAALYSRYFSHVRAGHSPQAHPRRGHGERL